MQFISTYATGTNA